MTTQRFVRFRRSPHLVSYWQEGALAVRNYETGVVVIVPPSAVELLDLFGDWQPASVAVLPGLSDSDVQRALGHLTTATLLQRSDDRTRRPSAMDMWRPWN